MSTVRFLNNQATIRATLATAIGLGVTSAAINNKKQSTNQSDFHISSTDIANTGLMSPLFDRNNAPDPTKKN